MGTGLAIRRESSRRRRRRGLHGSPAEWRGKEASAVGFAQARDAADGRAAIAVNVPAILTLLWTVKSNVELLHAVIDERDLVIRHEAEETRRYRR